MKDLDCTNSIIDKIQVKNGKKYYSTYISLTSRHMVESLFKVGIAPNKTGKEILPDIPKHLIRHFIRGFFDGDGTISFKKDGRVVVGFVSNNQMLQDIRTELKWDRLAISDCKDHNYINQIYNGNKKDIIDFYHYMYDDANVFLTRKKNRFDTFIANTEVTCEN